MFIYRPTNYHILKSTLLMTLYPYYICVYDPIALSLLGFVLGILYVESWVALRRPHPPLTPTSGIYARHSTVRTPWY
jgi:hypothetical protein